MENTFQPSLPAFRSKMAAIEVMELSTIGFIVWGLLLLVPDSTADTTLGVLIGVLFLIEGFLLGSWAIYIAYIRISRFFPSRVDIRLRIFFAAITTTYTLWAWILLDINRLILAKLLYRGEAPVEYAWSWRSKQRRKAWEQTQKASQTELYL
jgi:hypothetical protein